MAGRFFWSWLDVSCGLGDSVLLHSSLILPVGPVGEARTVFLMAVAEGKQEQTGPIMKHLHASTCVTFANTALAESSHMVVQSQSGRAL